MAEIGHDLAQEGGRLSASEAARLEKQVAADPADAQTRARLLGYYFLNRPPDPAVRAQHALWVIANEPRAALAGSPYCHLDKFRREPWEDGAALWRSHLDESPDDPELLGNARNWFTRNDPELALALGERVVELTGTAEARLRLAGIVRVAGQRPDADPEAAKALGRRVLTVLGALPDESEERPSWLQAAAWAALMAGEHGQARELADQMLDFADDDAWYAGNCKHHGHLVRGHAALAAGHIEQAEAELIAAGSTAGSPQLDSFGPNLSLADALVQRGQVSAVVAFLRDCTRFWGSPRSDDQTRQRQASATEQRVTEWISMIERGERPNFGPNLYYGM